MRKLSIVASLAEMKGCDINQMDCRGSTPLVWAARNGHSGVKLSTRLDRQRALASNPVVLRDFFQKVITPFPLQEIEISP